MGIKCAACNSNIRRLENQRNLLRDKNDLYYHKNSNLSYSPQKTRREKIDLIMPKLRSKNTFPISKNISNIKETKLVFIPECLIKENNDSPDKKYIIIRKIGQGGFGKVYYAKDKIFQKEVAIKKILKDKNNENNVYNLRILNEINILKKLCHPSIIKIYEVFNQTDEYYIVNEYCKFGDLVGQLKNGLDEMQISNILFQILSGISYLHFHGIIHRDLKLENILVSNILMVNIKGKISQYYHLKIIDFGTAKLKTKQNEKTIIGTTYYMAPEVINQNYNNKCDLWSIGVILYILMTGDIPFQGENEEKIINSILKGKYNTKNERLKKYPKSLQSLLRHLLDINLQTRYSADQALKCDFFKRYDPILPYKILIKTEDLEKYFNNLINYQLTSKIEQIFIAIICHFAVFFKEENNILIIFRYFNKEMNGLLTKKELYDGLIEYYKMKGEDTGDFSKYDFLVYGDTIEEIFTVLDTDNSGYIEYEEFIRGCVDRNLLTKEKYVKEFYDNIDKEGKNEITLQQIREAIFDITSNSKNVVEDIILDIQNTFGIKEEDTINFEKFIEIFQYSRNKYNSK